MDKPYILIFAEDKNNYVIKHWAWGAEIKEYGHFMDVSETIRIPAWFLSNNHKCCKELLEEDWQHDYSTSSE